MKRKNQATKKVYISKLSFSYSQGVSRISGNTKKERIHMCTYIQKENEVMKKGFNRSEVLRNTLVHSWWHLLFILMCCLHLHYIYTKRKPGDKKGLKQIIGFMQHLNALLVALTFYLVSRNLLSILMCCILCPEQVSSK